MVEPYIVSVLGASYIYYRSFTDLSRREELVEMPLVEKLDVDETVSYNAQTYAHTRGKQLNESASKDNFEHITAHARKAH